MSGAFEGTLAAVVTVRDGRVADVTLRSARRLPSAAMLRGKTCDEALRLVPLLFSVCGTAHALAAVRAMEHARGLAPPQNGAREALVTAEILDAHAFAIFVEWARALGGAPDAAALRRFREATARLRASVDPGRDVMAIGGARTPAAGADVEAALDAVQLAVDEACDGLPDGGADLARWANDRDCLAARFVRLAFARDAASFGASDVPPLPELDAGWFAARLRADPRFGVAPTVEGTPCETGPLARRADDPLVASTLRAYGGGVLARVVARLAEVRGLPAELRAAIDGGASAECAEGCAVADTSRGRLAHWVALERGRVFDWRCAAPTEWNFHPRGAFASGLVGARAPGLAGRAALHVLALDPCVPCEIALGEAA